jgi:hypothetical protein
MKLICPSCRRQIGEQSIDLASNRGTCDSCGTEVPIPRSDPGATALARVAPSVALSTTPHKLVTSDSS